MKSPFPGMDPYLEAHWRDVHARFIMYACDQLEPQLPSNLVARVEERVVVEPEEGDDRAIYPDVRVVQHSRRGERVAGLQEQVAVTEPVIVHYESEPATETFIHIIEPAANQRLITVLEILSRTNKFAGVGQQQYRQKQAKLCQGGVTLVEIDLLRSGKRVLSLPRIPRRLRTTYQACVRRGWKTSEFEIYPAPLRERLPIMQVPLREQDADIRLDMQSIVDEAYRKGRYFATIDYTKAPQPPLDRADSVWARGLIRHWKKRGH